VNARRREAFRAYFSDLGLWTALVPHRAILSSPVARSGRKQGISGPEHRDQLLNTDDVHDARQIVSEHAQRHLGGNLRQRLHEEVGRPHARLWKGRHD
jgi:hypothetical protein